VKVEVVAFVNATAKMRDPWSNAVNTKSFVNAAIGSVEAKCTVPVKSVATLPWLSAAVTVAASVVPAMVESGMPASTSCAAGPCSTCVFLNPVIEEVSVSVAESVCSPAVPNWTVTTLLPRSAGPKSVSGIGDA